MTEEDKSKIELERTSELFENARGSLARASDTTIERNVNVSDVRIKNYAVQLERTKKHLDRVKELIAQGADVNGIFVFEGKPINIIFYMWMEIGESCSQSLADTFCTKTRIKNSLELLKILIAAGLDVNYSGYYQSSYPNSILVVAIQEGAPIEIIEILLKAGARLKGMKRNEFSERIKVSVTPLEFLKKCFVHEDTDDCDKYILGSICSSYDGFYNKETADLIIKHLKLEE